MTQTIKDAAKNHWVYRMPAKWIPYLQLSRLDRPIGYWLLTLPGWIALSFAGLSHGQAWSDLKWALLILIGAVAMRGAGCTYNDIVDRDLDAQVDRTALRPIPAGTISVKQAWTWLLAQCLVGLIVLLFLPRLAQIIALCSIPLVAAYPFMKRITWWPQVWLGMTFNWAALVAYAAKTGQLSPAAVVLYIGLIFWTIGYDTIYACQDIEDDAFAGIKSTARRFGKHIRRGVQVSYFICLCLIIVAIESEGFFAEFKCGNYSVDQWQWGKAPNRISFIIGLFCCGLFAMHLVIQSLLLNTSNNRRSLSLFKSNLWAGMLLILPILFIGNLQIGETIYSEKDPCTQSYPLSVFRPLTPS